MRDSTFSSRHDPGTSRQEAAAVLTVRNLLSVAWVEPEERLGCPSARARISARTSRLLDGNPDSHNLLTAGLQGCPTE